MAKVLYQFVIALCEEAKARCIVNADHRIIALEIKPAEH
jgi:hypothetical protein